MTEPADREGVAAPAHEKNVVHAGDTILVTVADSNVPLDQIVALKKALEADVPEDVKVQIIVGAQATIVRGSADHKDADAKAAVKDHNDALETPS